MNKNLQALHIRFMPEQEQEMNISSREFFKKAEFINIDTLKSEKKETGGGNSGNGGQTQPSGDVPGEGD